MVDLNIDRTIMLKCVFKKQNAKFEMDKVKKLKIQLLLHTPSRHIREVEV